MMNPLPTIGKAYVMIMADEGERMIVNIYIGGGALDPTVL